MIQHIQYADLPAIEQLMRSVPDFWHDAWNQLTLQQALAASGDLALAWKEDGAILGAAFGMDCGFRGYLAALVVAENARNRGLGKKLLHHLQERLRARGCELLITDATPASRPFYAKLGWEPPYAVLLRKKL